MSFVCLALSFHLSPSLSHQSSLSLPCRVLKLASDAGATGAKLLIQLGFVCSATRDSITSDLIILAFHTKAAALPTNSGWMCLSACLLALAWLGSSACQAGLIWQGLGWRTWTHSTLR